MRTDDTSGEPGVAVEGDTCDASECELDVRGDTSGEPGVAVEGDTCDVSECEGDTCDAFSAAAVASGDAVSGDRAVATKQGVLRSAPSVGNTPVTRRARPKRALLDNTPPEASATDAGALDRCLRWILPACIAPILEASRTTGLRLVSLSLTGPDVTTIDQAAQSFARTIVDHPLGGALFALDRGAEHGRAHYHGIALLRSTDRVGDHWAEFAGARANEPKVSLVRDWQNFCREPYEKGFSVHLGRVVQYMTKPWPERYGRRSLDSDVIASGVFVGPMQAVRAVVAGGLTLSPESVAQVSPKCRLCLLCGKPLPLKARSNMERHGSCRRRASKAKRKVERAAEAQNRTARLPKSSP